MSDLHLFPNKKQLEIELASSELSNSQPETLAGGLKRLRTPILIIETTNKILFLSYFKDNI